MALGKVGGNQLETTLNIDSGTLYVDGTNNRVGINTTTPNEALTIEAPLSGDTGLAINYSGDNKAGITVNPTTGQIQIGAHPDLTSASGYYLSFNTAASNTVYERMRIDSSGNVGIGKSTGITDKLHIENTGANCLLSVARTDGAAGRLVMQHTSSVGALQTTSSVPLLFGTNDLERMRIDSSGNVFVGKTSDSASDPGVHLFNGGNYGRINITKTASGNWFALRFEHSGSVVGSITYDNSSTAFNTSSDYRLKTNVTYDWDATARLKQLRPARFEWIADGDDAVPVDGFLAHEVQDIVPEAISGTKDAVDDEGNPVYQGIDQSKLVPLLVKTIQELEARITALENA